MLWCLEFPPIYFTKSEGGAEHSEPHDSRGRRATGGSRCALGGEVKKMELGRGLAGG
jgi:hypothetical protein